MKERTPFQHLPGEENPQFFKIGMNILPSECDCEECSSMCNGPCCGTAEEIKNLIKLGYANRLMLDDFPPGPDLVKPALKGYEGKRSPWETRTEEGCTFWKEGKCELHNLGLKPMQGSLAHHSQSREEQIEIEDFIRDTWISGEDGTEVIEQWKSVTGKMKNI